VVNAAAIEQKQMGFSLSLPHPVEVEGAELLAEVIPCAEMVRFGKNGSDVTEAAVRVARAFTARDKIARAGYHGWQDWYIGSTSRNLGVPEAVRALTLTFPYNDLGALRCLFADNPDQIAGVILEPVVITLPLPGHLRQKDTFLCYGRSFSRRRSSEAFSPTATTCSVCLTRRR
jgi:glutamate-1-semialdehyde 2,1-aminomutase